MERNTIPSATDPAPTAPMADGGTDELGAAGTPDLAAEAGAPASPSSSAVPTTEAPQTSSTPETPAAAPTVKTPEKPPEKPVKGGTAKPAATKSKPRPGEVLAKLTPAEFASVEEVDAELKRLGDPLASFRSKVVAVTERIRAERLEAIKEWDRRLREAEERQQTEHTRIHQNELVRIHQLGQRRALLKK